MVGMVADMNYNLVVLVLPPLQEHGGGALLQQDGGAGPPLQGHGGEALLQQNDGQDDGAVLPQHGQGGVTRG